MRQWVACSFAYLTGVSVLMAFPHTAQARKVTWRVAGASVFGGACEPAEHTGYRGDYLPARPWSFAELGMGSALGGMPYMATIRVLSPVTHRRRNLKLRDIGRGGGDVMGHRRAIDLYEPALTYLLGRRNCNWTGIILWRVP